MTVSIHPFPARMASELAIAGLRELPSNSVVLDPMVGSGTVVRHASDLGFRALGFDMDPLAVLISRAWTTVVDDQLVGSLAEDVIDEARSLRVADAPLPWIDDHKQTTDFVRYWFGPRQRSHLRKLAFVVHKRANAPLRGRKRAALDILRVALSRIIITKDSGASLARDVSHSRPHRTKDTSDFDVNVAFARSVQQIRRTMTAFPPKGQVDVSIGDARSMTRIPNASVDAVLTSPPYLNAIDYMRGHRLALIWLGYSLADLGSIRASAIGAERAPEIECDPLIHDVWAAMVGRGQLSNRHKAMVLRYAHDLYRLMSEVARVVKVGGKATFVVGNSCLKDVFIRNSEGVARAGEMVGLTLHRSVQRKLPDRNRYLPLSVGPLNKRMRTESVLIFQRT